MKNPKAETRWAWYRGGKLDMIAAARFLRSDCERVKAEGEQVVLVRVTPLRPLPAKRSKARSRKA